MPNATQRATDPLALLGELLASTVDSEDTDHDLSAVKVHVAHVSRLSIIKALALAIGALHETGHRLHGDGWADVIARTTPAAIPAPD